MKAEKILFRDENRIKIDIPYSREAFIELKSLFPQVVYAKKKPETQAGKIITVPIPDSVNQEVTLHIAE